MMKIMNMTDEDDGNEEMSIAVWIEIVKICPFSLNRLETEYLCLSVQSHAR